MPDAAPDRLEITPRGPVDGRPRVPGSKSITNRALLLAALADGDSVLRGGLHSDDTVVMRQALDNVMFSHFIFPDPDDFADYLCEIFPTAARHRWCWGWCGFW